MTRVPQIYLDFNASTPIAPEVAEVMRPLLETPYGNPSSTHWAGVPAQTALAAARRQVAQLLGCDVDEIVFTSGGSEANNHALKGVFFDTRDRGDHIITTQIEHSATIEPCRFLERLGATVTYLPVDGDGLVDPDEVRNAVTSRTILVSVMHANNETGTIQPIEEISQITREREVLFHTDAAQSVGKIPVNVDALGVDLLSLAGHKLYAPKGVGALYVRRGTKLESLVHGGSHESGRRAGTESALLTVSLGKACEIAHTHMGMPDARRLRDLLWDLLRDAFGDRVVLNGHPARRVPNTLNVSFVGRVGADILTSLDGVAASTGSACHSGRVEISPVLTAMGVSAEIGVGAVRFSLGRSTTRPEIEETVRQLTLALGSTTRGRF